LLGSVVDSATRSGSEVIFFATTGKSLTAQENDAATKLQATFRGNHARAEMKASAPAATPAPAPGFLSSFLCAGCGSRGAANKKANIDILPTSSAPAAA
jgi:hypothetical protein